MPTGAEIRREVGRILSTFRTGPGATPVYLPVVNETAGTNLDAPQTLGSQLYTAQAFQGYYLRVADGSGASPNGVKTRVTTMSGGILTPSPGLPATLSAGSLVELWHPDLDPDAVDAARDRALAYRCTRWRRVPLTVLRDGDMQDPDTAAWGVWGAQTTFTKTALSERPFQERFATVATSGSYGFVFQDLRVRPGERWTYAALARARVGTAVLYIVNYYGGAPVPLEGNPSWDRYEFGLLRGSFVVPDDVQRIFVRLVSQGTGAQVDWAWVMLYPQDARLFTLPERVRRRSQVGTLYRLEGDAWPEVEWIPLPRPDVRGEARLVQLLPEAPGDALLFWDELTNYLPLQQDYHTDAGRRQGDQAETPCPLEYVAAATLYELFPGQFEGLYTRRHAQFGARPVPRFFREVREGVRF